MSRRRFVYRENEQGEVTSFEVSPDYTGDAAGGSRASDAEKYNNAFTLAPNSDGKPTVVDISSRTKRERFMRERGLTDPRDFSQTWAKESERRASWAKGDFGSFDDAARKADIGRAIYQSLEEQRKRR